MRRLVHTAIHRYDEQFCASILQRLSTETRTRLNALLTAVISEAEEQSETDSSAQNAQALEETEADQAEPAPPRPQSALHFLKQDAGPVRLESVLQESEKLKQIDQLGLPADLFSGVSTKVLQGYYQRIAVEELQEVRRHPDPIRFTLLSAFC